MDAATLKKIWQEPMLVEYGDVVQITQDEIKYLGLGDGYILQIGPISVPIRGAS